MEKSDRIISVEVICKYCNKSSHYSSLLESLIKLKQNGACPRRIQDLCMPFERIIVTTEQGSKII